MNSSGFHKSHSTVTFGSSSDDDDEVSSNASSSTMDRGRGTDVDDDSIDTLYKAMEMAEPIPAPVKKEASPSPPSFIAVDPVNRQATTTPVNVPTVTPQEEDVERPFIWVLLEFAKKRNWKKKLLTYVLCGVKTLACIHSCTFVLQLLSLSGSESSLFAVPSMSLPMCFLLVISFL